MPKTLKAGLKKEGNKVKQTGFGYCLWVLLTQSPPACQGPLRAELPEVWLVPAPYHFPGLPLCTLQSNSGTRPAYQLITAASSEICAHS